MKKIVENFKSNLCSDKADSALIIFLLSVPLLLIVMGFVSDLNKNVNARIAFSTAAQESAQSAIKTVDASGNLNNRSAQAFLQQYKYQVNPSATKAGDRIGTNEIAAYKSDTCTTVTVDGKERPAPYIELSLQKSRGADGTNNPESNKLTLSGPNAEVPANFNFGSGYKVINAEVYDVSTNNWGLFGLPKCQTHHSSVSAVAFGSNEDL